MWKISKFTNVQSQIRVLAVVSHEYLFALLDHVNISQFLTKSIKRIYNQFFASLVVDRYISDRPFYVMSGIKQGCSLSMANYTLGDERTGSKDLWKQKNKWI